MAVAYVYRRPFDYRAPLFPWTLYRPRFDVAATAASLVLASPANTTTLGKAISAGAGAVLLSGQAAGVAVNRGVVASAGALSLSGAQSGVAFVDNTAFTYRDMPVLVPIIHKGVFRGGFTVQRVRAPLNVPRSTNSGSIAANRGDLGLAGAQAAIDFVQSNTTQLLFEALRQAAVARRAAIRPIDRTAWLNNVVVEITVPTRNLTAYTGTLSFSSTPSSVLLSRNVAAGLATLSLGHPLAAIRLGKAIAATAGTLTLSGQTARIGTGRTVQQLAAAGLSLAGQASDTDLDKSIAANASVLSIVGLTASLGASLNVNAKLAVMALGGQTASAELDKAVAALAAELALSAPQALAELHSGVQATAAALSLDGAPASIDFERIVEAAVASLSLSAQAALIEGTQAVIVQIGRRTIRVRARKSTITVH